MCAYQEVKEKELSFVQYSHYSGKEEFICMCDLKRKSCVMSLIVQTSEVL